MVVSNLIAVSIFMVQLCVEVNAVGLLAKLISLSWLALYYLFYKANYLNNLY